MYSHESLKEVTTVNLSAEGIYKALSSQSYITVPFSIDRAVIEEAVQAFFLFLEEPESVKNHIDFSIAPLHRRADVGYKHRESGDRLYDDSKDFFHFHPALLERHQDFLTKQPVVNDFVLKAKPIWDLTYKTVWTIFNTMESDYPGLCDKIFNAEHVHILLRFLRYDWQSSGKYLAKPHYDAGSATLAIAESGPGLRIGKDPNTLQSVVHKSEEALFMLSSNFKKVIDIDTLSAGWHDVIQVDETAIGNPFSRWAIVAFIEAEGVEALQRTETHKYFKEAV